MSNDIHRALSAAVLTLLRPLARVLLRHGVAYGSFAELARKAYVDVAFENEELTGKRPTISGVSALTGLTRKETRRLKDLDLEQNQGSIQRYNRSIRVISGWVTDARFHDEHGEPAVLPVEGDGATFGLLVKEYSGDIPPAAMLSVLESSGTVVSGDSGVSLMSRAYIPQNTALEKLPILGTDVAELIDTISHNLDAEPGDLRFQRKVSNVLIPVQALEEFRRLSNEKSQRLLEEYHAWLSQHESGLDSRGKAPEDSRYVAVGIYYTEKSQADEE